MILCQYTTPNDSTFLVRLSSADQCSNSQLLTYVVGFRIVRGVPFTLMNIRFDIFFIVHLDLKPEQTMFVKLNPRLPRSAVETG